MNSDTWGFEELNAECKLWLATEVERTLVALRTSPPHSVWLEKHLDNLLWYWSVDRMKSGRVFRDAIPQGGGEGRVFRSDNPRTRSVLDAHMGVRSKSIRRDHVVPKRVLRNLLESAASVDEILQLLERFCFVAFIHIDEDADLNDNGLKQQMPDGWDDILPPLSRDPWARYRATGLHLNVQPPIPEAGPGETKLEK